MHHFITPRDKELHKIGELLLHLNKLLGIQPELKLELFVKDPTLHLFYPDYSEELFDRITKINNKQTVFRRLIMNAADPVAIELWDWWKKQSNSRATLRRQATNRRTASIARCIV
jgi:hypothetical protein